MIGGRKFYEGGEVAKDKLYLPSEEKIRAEMETPKAMFYLQQNKERGIDNVIF